MKLLAYQVQYQQQIMHNHKIRKTSNIGFNKAIIETEIDTDKKSIQFIDYL